MMVVGLFEDRCQVVMASVQHKLHHPYII